MKKRIAQLLAMTILLTGSMGAYASESNCIVLNSDNKLEIENLVLNAFEDMAPGDERYECIQLKNKSDKAAAFYIKQTTVQSMEADNRASGGAYQYDLLIGESYESATSILETVVGGYTADGQGRQEGLDAITELEEWCFLTELAPGESVNVYLSLKLDGEGNDNQTRSNYSDSVATLELSFASKTAAQRTIQGEDEVVIQYRDKVEVVEVKNPVKTGDSNRIFVYGGILLLGMGIVVVASKKSKKEE